MAEEVNVPKIITINVKTPKETQSIEIVENATVKEFKAKVSEKFNQPEDHLCLIFFGRILKDNETLVSYKIESGFTVHLMIKPEARGSAHDSTANNEGDQTSSSSNQQQNPVEETTDDELVELVVSLFPENGNFSNFAEVAQRLSSYPEILRRLLNSSAIQSFHETYSNMFSTNHVAQSMIASNPQLSHALSPEGFRQYIYNNVMRFGNLNN